MLHAARYTRCWLAAACSARYDACTPAVASCARELRGCECQQLNQQWELQTQQQSAEAHTAICAVALQRQASLGSCLSEQCC
eukprot:8058-Heterococcus_DN1.PRE.4